MTACPPWPAFPSEVAAEECEAPGRRRLTGLDVARALAMLGILVEHTLQYPVLQPRGALFAVYERSAPLFVLLAGAGLSLDMRPARPSRGRAMVLARVPLLLLIGMALSIEVSGVILQSFALFFLIGVSLAGLSQRVLAVVAGACLVGGPLLLAALRRAGELRGFGSQEDVGFGALTEPLDLVRGLTLDFYPAVLWLGFFLVGMVLGRAPLDAEGAGRRLFLGASAAAALLLTIGWAGARAFGPEPVAFGLAPSLPTTWSEHWTTYGFSEAVGWTLSATALALAVVGGSVWLARSAGRLRPLLAPIAALGAMSLSFYLLHFLYLDTLWADVEPGLDDRAAFLLASIGFWLVFALAAQRWSRVLRRGPVELVLHAVAAVVVRPGRGRAAVRS